MLVMCAVVACVMPPATGPSSRTATCLPERASRYAVVRPAMPAQTDWWRLIMRDAEQESVLTCLVSERYELLGASGMDADSLVELLLGGAELHRDGDALDHLAGVRADHVRADHALARPLDHQRSEERRVGK